VKPAEAEAERVRILADADAEKMKIQALAAASHNRVALDRMLVGVWTVNAQTPKPTPSNGLSSPGPQQFDTVCPHADFRRCAERLETSGNYGRPRFGRGYAASESCISRRHPYRQLSCPTVALPGP
jgi:hypothetical protein